MTRKKLDRTPTMAGEDWTSDQLKQLRLLLDTPITFQQIAEQIGRSFHSVNNAARKYHGVSSSGARKHAMSINKISKLFGVSWWTVMRWIQNKWLRVQGRTRNPAARSCAYIASWDDLYTFVEHREAWSHWSPATITDWIWREYAESVRDETWLTPMEVARRYFVTRTTVTIWLQKGLLPHVRPGHVSRIRERDLEGFVPPYNRQRGGGTLRRWTAQDDAKLLQLRNVKHETFAYIAVMLSRAVGAVRTRYCRLQQRAAQAAA